MRTELEWLDDALAEKDIVLAMTHYRVKDKWMTATNDRIIASHPVDCEGEFLVPGEELKQIFKRLPNEPKVTVQDDKVKLRSGRFSGTLQILPPEDWRFSGLETNINWERFPVELVPIFRDLRPFISSNAVHRWSLGIAIDHGWCYASNNIVLAGARFPRGATLQALVPIWVIDFILARASGLTQWSITETFMAFRWNNGAWMRSILINDRFPEKAGQMIQQTTKGTQAINEGYRQTVIRIAELSSEVVWVYADRVEGKTLRSTVSELLASEAPTQGECSIWSATHLASVMGVATSWSPGLWPKPVPFRGERVLGYIAGRIG